MNKCIYYAGNQYCNLHKSKVASAYCGDICRGREKKQDELNVNDSATKNSKE